MDRSQQDVDVIENSECLVLATVENKEKDPDFAGDDWQQEFVNELGESRFTVARACELLPTPAPKGKAVDRWVRIRTAWLRVVHSFVIKIWSEYSSRIFRASVAGKVWLVGQSGRDHVFPKCWPYLSTQFRLRALHGALGCATWRVAYLGKIYWYPRFHERHVGEDHPVGDRLPCSAEAPEDLRGDPGDQGHSPARTSASGERVPVGV